MAPGSRTTRRSRKPRKIYSPWTFDISGNRCDIWFRVPGCPGDRNKGLGCGYLWRVNTPDVSAMRLFGGGHDAVSCDLLPTDAPGPHYQGDVLDIIGNGWDMMIAHPPCTHLAISGARHFAAKRTSGVQQKALEFVQMLLDAPIPKIALENPVSIISSRIRKPDQIIQPWMFGHGETKATCLWLKDLPKLIPTNTVPGREARVHRLPPSPFRWKLRSTTFQGIAAAMAAQWGTQS